MGQRRRIEFCLEPGCKTLNGTSGRTWSTRWRHHAATQFPNDSFPNWRLCADIIQIERIQCQSRRPKLTHQR
jgi:hypothetical protein